MSDSSGVEARGVTKIFGGGAELVRALNRVSVRVRENEFFTLLGPSGCGKTTLLRLIAGFEQPSEGEILLDGAPVTHLPPNRRLRTNLRPAQPDAFSRLGPSRLCSAHCGGSSATRQFAFN